MKQYMNLQDYKVLVTPLASWTNNVKGTSLYNSVKIFQHGWKIISIQEYISLLIKCQPLDIILPLTEDPSYAKKSGHKTNIRCIRKALAFLD